jgi:hypothetical protein
MLDDLIGSPAQMLTWTSALDLADELLTLWLAAARARPSSVAYLMLARTELAGWTADMLGGLNVADRGIEISREIGSHVLTGWTHAFASRLCAAMANERGCVEHGAAATELGARLNEPGPYIWAAHARGQFLLGTGRTKEAVEVLKLVADFATLIGFKAVRALPWQPDYIEALARSGQTTEADTALQAWLAAVPAEPDDWHRAVIARCRVLVQGDEDVDALEKAIRGGALRLTPLEEARAQLKRFASSGDMAGHQRDRPQWRRNEYGNQWVTRMRWMPRSAAAMTSARVSPARLASSTPLRLDHSASTGLRSGA